VDAFNRNRHATRDPSSACLYFVLTNGEWAAADELERLPHWGGDGRNHAVFFLPNSSSTSSGSSSSLVHAATRMSIGRAMRIDSTFSRDDFRRGFDLLVPPFDPNDNAVDVEPLIPPPFSPARRRYLLSFHGFYRAAHNDGKDAAKDDAYYSFVTKELGAMQSDSVGDKFFFQFKCATDVERDAADGAGGDRDWHSCPDDLYKTKRVMEESTFCLVLGSGKCSISDFIDFSVLRFCSLFLPC
jgi:alpha-1,4-N-acetylglucosaminyltransferase EXTL3